MRKYFERYTLALALGGLALGYPATGAAAPAVNARSPAALADGQAATTDPATPAADAGSESDPAERGAAWRPGFGARIGGYGFRRSSGEGSAWDACRMGGAGVFGTLDLNRHVFGELGLDFYTADDAVRRQGMDRVSTHALVSAGLRMFPDFIITPTVQLGGGAEWTRIEVPGQGVELERLYPLAFVGLGLALNPIDHLELGASVRFLASMHPKHYTAASEDVSWDPEAGSLTGGEQPTRFQVDPDVAAQALFHLRYAL